MREHAKCALCYQMKPVAPGEAVSVHAVTASHVAFGDPCTEASMHFTRDERTRNLETLLEEIESWT